MQDYRKPKRVMEARREKRRGRRRPTRTWEKERMTLAELRRPAVDRIAIRQWTEDPTL
jgi:hypothetical protein